MIVLPESEAVLDVQCGLGGCGAAVPFCLHLELPQDRRLEIDGQSHASLCLAFWRSRHDVVTFRVGDVPQFHRETGRTEPDPPVVEEGANKVGQVDFTSSGAGAWETVRSVGVSLGTVQERPKLLPPTPKIP